MIRKLRLKFICVNMLIVTVMLTGIFTMVYHFTRYGMETRSIAMLQAVASEPFQHNRPGDLLDGVQLPFFILDLDAAGNIMETDGYFDLSDLDYLQTLVSAADNAGGRDGVLSAYGLRFCRSITPRGERIAFADMSSERATLSNLIKTCILVGAACFAAFLIISWLLARWAVKPVETAWKQQRQFVADASHELKTPLTVIMTNAELLNSPSFDQARRSQFAAHILTMSRQMRQLIEEMLDLARTDNGQGTLVFSPVDLSRLVNDAVLPFEPVFFERGLTLTADIQEHITVSGSQQHLRQITDILLDNAQKYSSSAGEVTVQLTRQGGRCRLSVSNPGDALSKAERKDIFKRFYRTDEAHSQRGSYGLGLSIAANIAAMHRGKIWVESSNGRNIFHLELPVKSGGRCGAGQSS
ncbi:MAG: HAMP domain-containing sensor histidine kinase [Dysosmobacter sp.]|nr:HAMP domain-containing sensor histidine kinase [Dysosmobacter sp.]MDY3867092.1 HAMP domain-containing sensor histidine kinase [Dysosmobacter sp.]